MIHNRCTRSVHELSDHLRMILQKERDMEIPEKPPVDLPQCQNLPILGTFTDEVRMLDRKSLESEDKIREAATKTTT